MRPNGPALYLAFIFFFSGVLDAEELRLHRVKSHETLSVIAKKYFGKPIYGEPQGSLSKVKKLNPQIRNIHLIFPGQIVYLQTQIQRQLTSTSTAISESIPSANAELRPTSPSLPVESPPESPKQEVVTHQALVSASYGITNLSAVDMSSNATAHLFLSHDLSVSAAWKQKWTTTFSSAFSAKLRSLEVMPSTNVSKNLSGTRKTTTELAIKTEYQLSPSFSWSLGAAYGSELFLHGMDSVTVMVDTIPIPSAHVEMNFEIYQRSKTSVEFSGGYRHLFPASTDSYTINPGKVYQGAFSLHRKYGQEKEVTLTLGYQDRLQETSLVRLREQSFVGSLILTLPLFEGDQK